jgi:hypothetical protein
MNVTHFVRTLCVVALFAAPAFAIPTNPDPIHTPAATPWPNPLPPGFNPAADVHQHWNTNPITGQPGLFATYSVWDDNVYRYSPIQTTQGHGYMQNAATFEYDPLVPGVAIPLFNGAVVNTWQNAVNGPGFNTNGHPVNTKLNFVPAGPGLAGDFLIKFDTKYKRPVPNPGNPNQPNYVDENFPSSGSINPDGTMPNNPNGPGAGSDGVLAFWTPGLKTLTFNSTVNWYYLNAFAPAPNQFDFITTAMHEFGHVIGLDHQGPPGVVMYGSQSSYEPNGMGGSQPRDPTTEVRFPDFGAQTGSKVLYTIAVVPEPSSFALVGLMSLAIVARRKRAK